MLPKMSKINLGLRHVDGVYIIIIALKHTSKFEFEKINVKGVSD